MVPTLALPALLGPSHAPGHPPHPSSSPYWAISAVSPAPPTTCPLPVYPPPKLIYDSSLLRDLCWLSMITMTK